MMKKGKNRPLISIVIPVYKGASTIGPLVDGLIENLDRRYRIEIVLVNDHSPDNSEAACIELFRKHQKIVRFFSLSKNAGEHNAVMAGLNQTIGDWALIMDDDFQNPVGEVGKLIDAALDGKDDVIYTYYSHKRDSLFRNFGSWFHNKAATMILKKPGDLYLSSFKILNRFVIDEIIKYTLPYPHIDGLLLQATDAIGRIQVRHDKRQDGRSSYTLKKLIHLWLNMFVNFSVLPLRIATFFGFFFSLLGLGLGVWVFFERLGNPNLPLGWPTLAIAVSMFSGVQLIAVGWIGEYVGRIYISQNKKPQYVIRRAFERKR
jgi:undecaprenyl-phosphate 4-deoxy-4-formamido-L-arabinose transferase